MYSIPAHKVVGDAGKPGQIVNPAIVVKSISDMIPSDADHMKAVGLLALRKAKRWLGRSLENYSPDFRSASSAHFYSESNNVGVH